MAAINWVEAFLGLALCGFGLYLTAFRKANAGVRLETGAVKLSVSNTGAFLILLGVVLLVLARVSSVAWRDLEIQLNRAEGDRLVLAGRLESQRRLLADARAQAAALAAAGTGSPGRATVPDLTGLPYDRAVALIRRHNLDTLAMRWVDRGQAASEFGADTAGLAPGSVVGQAVPPGTRVPGRSRVLVMALDRN